MKKNLKKNSLTDEIIRAIFGEKIADLEKWVNEETIHLFDRDGRNIVIHAVISNKIKVLKFSLERNGDPNVQDKNGWSALHYAAQNYSLELAEALIRNGAIVDCEDNYGNTPLWRAVFSSQGRGGMIELLLRYGADRNKDNHYGVSPYKLARSISDYDIIQFFENN